ncbi:hypothetical protein TH53_12365 [Pedobacter lusitanus]|uniref:SnoaL-like domain-containing protein n=1 Tax=Pedobacter lusitanus TaxID=1503925 RepID=A0A0D0F5P3_9SPHI|nr:nuclear transport factor 2 family protein [Pedobacter lusitanus]KIO76888.1 hypothetical protein TH53_12365 [Pedobacter lusitanus]
MKHLATVFLAALTLISCHSKDHETMVLLNNQKLVKTYFEHFNNHEWKKMAGMYVENAEFKDPSLGKGMTRQSREQIIKKYRELNQLFPDIKDQVINIYPSGDHSIIVEFVSTGTASDQTKFELPVCTIFTFEKGLITKDFTYYDNFE